jgi:3-(methylthio)propanoyl-CoA dehydrogenase
LSEYRAPLADIDFALRHIADIERISKLNGFQHAELETVSSVLAEAARFFSEVIAPTNRIGDEIGSVLDEQGAIRTPPGFKEAYKKYVEAGWAGVHIAEEWGGGGFPYSVGLALQEMFKASNMAFSLCPLLTHAAIESLIAHGSPEQRATYLEKLVTGEWTGTMCLTEPQAGSDVGEIITKAVLQDDGTYRIFGQKIFITWGDQDLTDNIIHLVLARTPGAAPGTKGISLFIVPKFLVGSDGKLGTRNDYKIVSIEHKLGINASPTCVVSFGDAGQGAIGYLVGEEQQGMKYMFTMMNTARVGVGIEGLAIGEGAYQKAVSYARERRQGRVIGSSSAEMAPIIEHPDVRRNLATMRAYNEAMRALLYLTAASADLARHGETDEERTTASNRLALLTPVAKAWCTDLGVEVASLGIQVHGGMGFIEETGAAQFYRDARIAPIYEGTNGIQAMDLVMRKLPLENGAVIQSLLSEIQATIAEMPDSLGEVREALAGGLTALAAATTHLGERLMSGAYEDALAGATPYLRMMGTVLGGWLLAGGAIVATREAAIGGADRDFLLAKIATARFYATQILPQAAGLGSAVTSGAEVVMGVSTT